MADLEHFGGSRAVAPRVRQGSADELLLDQPVEFDRLAHQGAGPRLHDTEVQQVLDQLLQLQAAVVQDTRDLGLLLVEGTDHLFAQQFRTLADRGERGFQLV